MLQVVLKKMQVLVAIVLQGLFDKKCRVTYVFFVDAL